MPRFTLTVSGLLLALVVSLPAWTEAWPRPFQGCKVHPSEATCSFSDPFVEECDSSILGYAYSPDNRVLAVLRYSPSCLSAWTVATNNSGVFNPRVRATITSSDGFGSARDEINAAVSEMLYVGPERPDRKVKALGRLFDNVTGKVLSVAETPFVDP